MISYVRGELASVEPDKAVVDVGGVGYGVFMPQQALSMLPSPGSEVKLYTYLNVKEDAMQLFGFLTKDDLEIFKLVIGVSGIGPKGGLNILSCMTPDDLRFAIMSGDAKAISAAPGIGKKTAERIVLELHGKISADEILGEAGEARPAALPRSQADDDAVAALMNLGFTRQESARSCAARRGRSSPMRRRSLHA